jgi:hypothetical protein
MKRRSFLSASFAGVASKLVPARSSASAVPAETVQVEADCKSPFRTITAAVDAILPADPDIPGDFKASDYGADYYIAQKVGFLGQLAMAFLLNVYAMRLYFKLFIHCDLAQRQHTLVYWAQRKDSLSPLEKDLLIGLVTMSCIGVFEQKTPDVQEEIYTSMGWYDPSSPEDSFWVPCDGYTF